MEGAIDEVKCYLNFKYVSSIEAMWRIFEFQMPQSGPVYCLSVYLPDEQVIIYNPT